ncbi:hypothetical protein [Streptomyces sp. NPDC058758]|uniref:hypothetical protein n=1 Tax=Streptomyces sp. NPDC058758 TaxID=3346627 RepID=UPI00369FBE5D
MPTPRTRKTTADTDAENKAIAPEDTTEETAEDKAVAEAPETKSPALDSPTAPEVAPLEPPAATPPPAKEEIRNSQQILPAHISNAIVDDATGLPPADLDNLFQPVAVPYGSGLRATCRLVEHVGMGAYNTPTTRLLIPAGAEIAPADAQRILDRLRTQADQK